MKNIYNLCFLVLFFIFTTSCDKGFDELNQSKTSATAIDPAFILNRAIFNASTSTIVYEFGIVQQIISPFSGVLAGANYNQDNRASTLLNWGLYGGVIKNTRDVIEFTKDDPARSNLMNMARIYQAYAFMILTDTYGDIPYTDGGSGFYSHEFFPAYDTQQSIYPKLIAELTEATAALNASGKIETADVFYGGDIAKWKKFGYSLLLRAGMRLSKADPGTAQTVVNAAVSGGVITSNADNAKVPHDTNYRNPIGNVLNSNEGSNYYLTKPFVDALKNSNDPRLTRISIRFKGAKSVNDQKPENGSILAADQIGMPMGYDNGSIKTAVDADGLQSLYDYSQVDKAHFAGVGTPMFIVTAGQNNLLLAEARQRGWITTGTAQQYFHDGIRRSLEQIAQFDATLAIPDSEIEAYIAANPLNSGTELKQINTQYWISSFMNGPETWANFRRSGYPELTPNPYPGKEVVWINRLTYPNSEISVNSENLKAAIAIMGPDDLNTKVWWDK